VRCFQVVVAACAMLLESIRDNFLRRLTLLQLGKAQKQVWIVQF
jgi:hypothetical protein